jgi:hypothetical protein
MKSTITFIALFFSVVVFGQNPYWVVYDFEVHPDHEASVVNSFNQFFSSETGKMLPSASLSVSMFANSETKFTHRMAFWSDDAKELGKLYSNEMRGATDAQLMFSQTSKHLKPTASYLGKALIWAPNTFNYSTVYVLGVSDPATYAAAFSEMRDAMMTASGGKLGLDLHVINSGNEPGATHAVVASAASFEDLLTITDMVFSSDAFKTFARKVKDIRTILNRFTLYRAFMFNVEE